MAQTGREIGWRRRLVWIALALSLTLNVFFIGGLMWTKTFVRPPLAPIERLQRLGQSLNLDDRQQQAFEQFIRVIRQRGRDMRENNQALLKQIWTELAKPNPDNDLVARLGGQVNDNRVAFQKEASAALLAFTKELQPEQRSQLAETAQSARDEPSRRLFQMIAP